MGIFQSIYSSGAFPQGRRFQKAQSRLERAQINARIQDIQARQEHRKRESPREQAQLKQSAWARGLGKSSIAEQDKERLTFMQRSQDEALDRAMHVAIRTKQYLKKKRRHDRVSGYLAVLDEAVAMVPMFGGSGGQQNPEASGSANGAQQYGWGTMEW